MKDNTIQAQADRKRDTSSRQQAAAGPNAAAAAPPGYGIDFLDRQPGPASRAGLPGPLKTGIETLSGLSMDNVRVHYNSPKPAQLQALAYTQGTDIHLAPGQERHLPHEAWHVVQQAQGRVQPTMQMKGGVPVNDDKGLEREADVMGERAAQAGEGMRDARPGLAAVGPTRGECLQRRSWEETKEKAYDSMIAGIRKARDGMRDGLKRLASDHLPAYLLPVANDIIEQAVMAVDGLVSLIMAVVGIVVGFGEGVIGMIEGLLSLSLGVLTILYDLIVGLFTNFDAAKQDLKVVWEALKSLPSALKKLVTDWLDKFGKASSERQSLMIGELTGQVLALIATYALAAGRAGGAAKAAAAGGDAAAATGGTAAVAGAAGDAAATAARARPVLTVIEGGGGRGGGAAARAAAGPGVGDMAGNTALKVAPVADPVAPPLRLVPPPPAPVAEGAARAMAPQAAAASGARSKVAAAAVAAAAAKKAGKGNEPPAPLNSMRFQVQWGTNQGGPTFSRVAVAPADPGVTTAQAVVALWDAVRSVAPAAAQAAAEPAAVRQQIWILNRPPAGIGPGAFSKSEYFRYLRYTDARVDVENQRGQNLRI